MKFDSKVINNHSHILYFTYFYKNEKLQIILVDSINRIYFGECECKLKTDEKKILDWIEKNFEPKRRFFSKQSNTMCGFSKNIDSCCCKRQILEDYGSYFAGKKYHITVFESKLILWKVENPRNCRHAMFSNRSDFRGGFLSSKDASEILGKSVGYLINSSIERKEYGPKCGFGRRRYYVKDGVVSSKLGVFNTNIYEVNKKVESRKKNLQTVIEEEEMECFKDLNVFRVFDLNKIAPENINRRNKSMMVKIALGGELNKIFKLFKKGNIDDKKHLKFLINNIVINDSLFKFNLF